MKDSPLALRAESSGLGAGLPLRRTLQQDYEVVYRDLDQLPVARVPLRVLSERGSPRRSGPDLAHVRVLAESDGPLPPILVRRPGMKVIDGVHRLLAAKMRGLDMIDARLVDGDHASCFVLAVRANVTHGLPLSLADRKAAALDIIRLYPHWSDRMIASLSGLAGRTVAGLRGCLTEKNRQLDSRIGRDGRIRPSDIVERRRAAADLIARQPGASLREIARQAGISPETAREVRRQVNQGRGSGSRAFPAAVPPPPDRPASADRADPPQASMMLAALRGDPALRSSERGRLLLRMLGAAEVLPKHSEQIIDAVPAHSIKRVAEASRACAQAWEWFAAYAERKAAAIRSTG